MQVKTYFYLLQSFVFSVYASLMGASFVMVRTNATEKLSLSDHLILSQHDRLFRNGIFRLFSISWAYPPYILKSGSSRVARGRAANVFGEVLIVHIRVSALLVQTGVHVG